jgi:hypothetical protein
MPRIAIVTGAMASALLAACATGEEFAGASPVVVEDCRREVTLLTERDQLTGEDDPLQGPALESAPEPIEDARAAREVAGGAGFADWPEEALMYRCLRSRGVELSADQSEMLAEWEQQAEPEGGVPEGSVNE